MKYPPLSSGSMELPYSLLLPPRSCCHWITPVLDRCTTQRSADPWFVPVTSPLALE